MTRYHRAAAALAVACLANGMLVPPPSAATEAASSPAAAASADEAAFAWLRSLEGTWTGRIDDAEKGAALRLTYEVVSGGRAVIEKIAPGSKGEMVTVYYLAGGRLRATHYCAIGNQPAYRFREGVGGRMVFEFDGGTGFDAGRDPHVHEGWIEPAGPDHIRASWTHWQGGASTGSMLWHLWRR